MKEITRIHIAKTSYDIEIPAKKKLESYIEDLSIYAEDDNVLEDIEIRITELLAARGVKPNGVISNEDISSIRETLGEPKDFSSDGDMAIGPDEIADDLHPKRKLYRDIDTAVIGGVLGGFANYFKINVLWVRLAFIFLIFISLGFAFLLYAILWIAIPAAQSVTEKLQMAHQPITLGSIRKYNESQEGMITTKERLKMRKKGFGILIGIVALFGTLTALAMTITGAVAWTVFNNKEQLFDHQWIVFSLVVVSGLLLTTLGILISYAGFKAKVTKRLVVTSIAIIIAGVVAASSAAIITGYQTWQRHESVQQSIKERALTLPKEFKDSKTLTINAENTQVEYRVSDDMSAVLTAVPEVKATITNEGSNILVKVEAAHISEFYMANPTIIIYGPAVETISAIKGNVKYIAKSQAIGITSETNASVSLWGNFSLVNMDIKSDGSIDAEAASVAKAIITMQSSSSALLGNVEALEVTQPTACGNNTIANVSVQNIADGTMTYNGKQLPKATHETSCGIVEIGSDNYDSRDY